MTKQEVIRSAWEKVLPENVKWEDVKHYIDSEGWLNKSIFEHTELKYYQIKSACSHIENRCRIISLEVLNPPLILITMENNKLISATEFILHENRFKVDDAVALLHITSYAHFLKEPLTLGMFIPCSPEGEVLEEPKTENYDEEELAASVMGCDYLDWQEAKERVLFEGWHVIGYEKDEEGVFTQIELKDEDLWLDFLSTGEVEIQNNNTGTYIETIEDLVTYNLTLTENAKKLYYGKKN